MRVVVTGLRAERAGEHIGDIRTQLVHGRHDDVARRFVIELLDDSPDTVKKYLEYLHSGRINLQWTKTCSHLQWSDNLPDYHILAHV